MIETVIDMPLRKYDVWHTRHWIIGTAFYHIAGALAAYTFFDHKPRIRHNKKKSYP